MKPGKESLKNVIRNEFYRDNVRRNKNDDDKYWDTHREIYQRQTGESDVEGRYYIMRNAIKNNDMDAFYESAEEILEHGGNAEEEARTVTDALNAGTIDRNQAFDMVRYIYNQNEKTDDEVMQIVNGAGNSRTAMPSTRESIRKSWMQR